jgi:hypothetical protein
MVISQLTYSGPAHKLMVSATRFRFRDRHIGAPGRHIGAPASDPPETESNGIVTKVLLRRYGKRWMLKRNDAP